MHIMLWVERSSIPLFHKPINLYVEECQYTVLSANDLSATVLTRTICKKLRYKISDTLG
jgi:hypothetical protein